MVVVFDVQAALADGQQPRAEGVGVQVGQDVGGVHDTGQPGQRRVVTELVFVDEYLEGAQFPIGGAAVGVGGVFRVEGVPALAGGDGQDLVGGNEQDLGVGVDE